MVNDCYQEFGQGLMCVITIYNLCYVHTMYSLSRIFPFWETHNISCHNIKPPILFDSIERQRNKRSRLIAVYIGKFEQLWPPQISPNCELYVCFISFTRYLREEMRWLGRSLLLHPCRKYNHRLLEFKYRHMVAFSICFVGTNSNNSSVALWLYDNVRDDFTSRKCVRIKPTTPENWERRTVLKNLVFCSVHNRLRKLPQLLTVWSGSGLFDHDNDNDNDNNDNWSKWHFYVGGDLIWVDACKHITLYIFRSCIILRTR